MESKKWFTLVEIMIVVVIIGLLVLMAIPAFNRAREQFLEREITENLRKIASAGQQYILEQGTTEVGYTQLQGDYFQAIASVADETYTNVIVSEDGGTISASTSGGLSVVFTY